MILYISGHIIYCKHRLALKKCALITRTVVVCNRKLLSLYSCYESITHDWAGAILEVLLGPDTAAELSAW